VYVKTASSPVIYAVGEWVSRDLDKPVDDFRDKTVLVFDKDKVKAIDVTRKDGTSYTLTRGEDGKWKLEKGEAKVAPNLPSGFVNDLATLKATGIAGDDVTDLAAYGLDPAALRVKVIGADGAEVGTLLLGSRDANGKKEYTAARAGG